MNDKEKKLLEKVIRNLTDQGLVVEAGWQTFRAIAMNSSTPIPIQDAFKEAFFAGANYLFDSIMTMLEEGEEGTPADYKRLDSILAELKRFDATIRLKYGPPGGRA